MSCKIQKTEDGKWELLSEDGTNLITLADLELVEAFAKEGGREYVVEEPTPEGEGGGSPPETPFTEAATVTITGAPVQGANMTLTSTAALVVASGNVGFGVE